MDNPERNHLYLLPRTARYLERHIRLDLCQRNTRHPRIRMLGKTIRNTGLQTVCRILLGIYGHITEMTKWTQIVQSAHMVIVFMRNQNAVNRLEIGQTEALLPKIGTAID